MNVNKFESVINASRALKESCSKDKENKKNKKKAVKESLPDPSQFADITEVPFDVLCRYFNEGYKDLAPKDNISNAFPFDPEMEFDSSTDEIIVTGVADVYDPGADIKVSIRIPADIFWDVMEEG